MKTALIMSQSTPAAHLVVYFAGWGTPISAVSHLRLPEDHDLLICYDYQDLQLDFDFSTYDQIHLVAWSMGVWVANQVMSAIPLVSAVAINGTGLPCHDQFGIPCDIFEGTLAGLNEENRIKFERRMCGDKQTFAYYQSLPEQRDLQEIHAELTALYDMIKVKSSQSIQWTRAWIAEQDRIFPMTNQLAYWQSISVNTQLVKGAHYWFLSCSHWADLWECDAE